MRGPILAREGAAAESRKLFRGARGSCLMVGREGRTGRPMAAGSSAVQVIELSKRFGSGAGAVLALDRVSVEIGANEFFTLLGPSGCGKTTLLRLIAGLEQPSAGELHLEGRPIGHLPPFKRPVNTVFQSYALFPHMSVAKNVAFGLEMQGRGRTEIARDVAATLELVRLAGLEDRYPAQLSGGQQQRVALARALASHPKVLLLDEPLSALDLKLRQGMQLELKRLQHDTGITFIFVTHDQQEALTMSDRIAVMARGRILQIGTSAEIYEHPNCRFVADFIGDTNLIEAVPDGQGFRLGAAGELVAAGGRPANGAKVTLAVRPERVDLAPPATPDTLKGRVEEVVYVGSDTSFHIRLDAGPRLRVRVQNRDGAARAFQPGDPVGVRIPPAAVQVLED
jgi:spermidine/putrescine transport system ATP-binding protein